MNETETETAAWETGSEHDTRVGYPTGYAAAGSVSAMAGFPVPRYPAGTAGRDRGVARWIPGPPVIVAGLAGRWWPAGG